MPQNANLFVQEITLEVIQVLPNKVPADIAKALMTLGYIQRSTNAFIKTEIGETILRDQSICCLSEEVIDVIREGSGLGVEKFKCYLCERLKSDGHFGPRCQFEYEDDEPHRVSMSPCNSCLASHHITQSRMFG